MNSLVDFFKRKKDDGSQTHAAIQKLKETQDLLQKKSDFLESKKEEQIQIAKKHGTKNKRLALQALAHKRRYEKQLEQIDSTLMTIENHIESLENAGVNIEILNAMKMGTNALKDVNKNMSVDDVQNIMDEINWQRDVCQEVSNVISTPMSLNVDYDEDDLLNELNELENEEIEKQLINITPNMPEIPNNELVVPSSSREAAKKKQLEDDISALAEWAN